MIADYPGRNPASQKLWMMCPSSFFRGGGCDVGLRRARFRRFRRPARSARFIVITRNRSAASKPQQSDLKGDPVAPDHPAVGVVACCRNSSARENVRNAPRRRARVAAASHLSAPSTTARRSCGSARSTCIAVGAATPAARTAASAIRAGLPDCPLRSPPRRRRARVDPTRPRANPGRVTPARARGCVEVRPPASRRAPFPVARRSSPPFSAFRARRLLRSARSTPLPPPRSAQTFRSRPERPRARPSPPRRALARTPQPRVSTSATTRASRSRTSRRSWMRFARNWSPRRTRSLSATRDRETSSEDSRVTRATKS